MIEAATPLTVLEAFAIDTETTGLDPATARIVEFGAVRVSRGAVADQTFRRLVNPGVPIPVSSARIHGIDDASVAGAATFADVWREILSTLDRLPLIGHSIGFDLAVIGRECARAGLSGPAVRFLDVELLARSVAPQLPDHSLDRLAAWLEIEVEGRHSALGDALTAARVFCGLIPRLRAAGIRTLADAEATCRMRSDALAARRPAAWVEPRSPAAHPQPAPPRLDSHPYRHRVRDVMSGQPRFVPSASALGEALSIMIGEKISSVFAHESEGQAAAPADPGILTERDILRAMERQGAAALSAPVGQEMSRPLACVAAEDFLYKAAARMRRLGVRHLGVVDEAGRIVGALSARDLLRSAGGSAIALGDEIDAAETISDLAAAWAGLPAVANALRADGVTGREVAAVISEELGRATMAAARIVGRRMQTGRGGPPCEYAVAVLGSAGRGESLLALDQDNALVFAHGAPGGREDAWFAELGAGIADILDEIGVPYCKGGVMARNAEWRGSLETWRQRIAGWIARTTPEDLLSVDIFYDLRAVYGHTHLGLGLRSEAYAAAAGNAGFAKLIAASVGALEPGLGLFHRIRTVNGRIDLKRAGLIAIVGAARAIAVRHGAEARSTPDRLRAAKARSPEGHTDLDALIEAHGVLMDLILDQQIADLGHGIPPSNSVSVKTLSRASQERLRQALRSVEHIDTLTRDLLFRG